MMQSVLSTAVWLIGAASLQGALSERLAFGWFRPDFLLVVAVVLSIHRSTDASAVTGFFAGLFDGALRGKAMMALIISRTLACVASVRLYSAFLGSGVITASVVVLITSVISSVLYLFLGAPKDILGWLADTIGAALYNGVLAVPCYLLYCRLAPHGVK